MQISQKLLKVIWKKTKLICGLLIWTLYHHFRCVARHAKVTKNNKFDVSVQYLKKKLVMKFFCMQLSMKFSYKFLMAMVKQFQSSQNSKFAIFCMQINIKISYKLISTLCASRFPTRWNCHYWWAWSIILKVLQQICNIFTISQKKVSHKAFQ